MTQCTKRNRWMTAWANLFGTSPARKHRRRSLIHSQVEVLEERILLFAITGLKWAGDASGTTITYSYSNLLDGGLSGASPVQLKAAVEEALTLWASYAPLNFIEQPDSGPPPSDGGYSAFGHPLLRFGYHFIDGNPTGNQTLAHGFPPQINGIGGDVHFDSGNTFVLPPSQGIDFLYVAVHEIGHALGLAHSDVTPSIMAPSYPNPARYSGLGTAFLDPDDINGIRFLYDDHLNSPTLSTSLSINTSETGYAGVYQVSGDTDWFSFNVTEGQTYRILLDTQTLSHGKLTLYDTDGSTVLLTGDGLGAGTDPWLIFTADTTGTYYVSASGNTTEEGSYSISYTQVDGMIATTQGANAVPEVRVFNSSNTAELFRYMPYPGFGGGAHVAMSDVNGDGIADVITGAGAGAGAHVRVVSGANGDVLMDKFPYPSFTGGVRVASGDVNGDGKADVITAAGAPGGSHIIVYSGHDGSTLHNIFAYTGFFGGVYVASGDVNNDGYDDIITGPGAGGGPHVKVFSGTNLALLQQFFAYDLGFLGGVFVAAGDVNGDGHADIITGPGAGGGPNVRVFSGANLALLHNFHAYDPANLGGVRVGAMDLNMDGYDDIITGPGGGGPHVRVFNGLNSVELLGLFAYDHAFTSGIFVAGAPASFGTGGGSLLQSGSSFQRGSTSSGREQILVSDEVLGRAFSVESVAKFDSESDEESVINPTSNVVTSDESPTTNESISWPDASFDGIFDDEFLEILLKG